MSEPSPFIVETTDATFETDVVERSRDVPVLVDFWAEWCGPCRMLSPVLENLATEYAGKFVLAKANTEAAPAVAAEFRVRSIPAVFAVREGRVVDSFVGALPEPSIRSWIDRLLPTPAETTAAQARALEDTDADAAEANYREALKLAPDLAAAKVGLARVLLNRDRVDEARGLIGELERRGFLEPEVERVKAELALRSHAGPSGGIEQAQAAVEANPGDRGLKLQLAEALAAGGRYEEALALGLELVELDRKSVGEAARKLMLNIFQLLPADSELAGEYRRQLAAALF